MCREPPVGRGAPMVAMEVTAVKASMEPSMGSAMIRVAAAMIHTATTGWDGEGGGDGVGGRLGRQQFRGAARRGAVQGRQVWQGAARPAAAAPGGAPAACPAACSHHARPVRHARHGLGEGHRMVPRKCKERAAAVSQAAGAGEELGAAAGRGVKGGERALCRNAAFPTPGTSAFANTPQAHAARRAPAAAAHLGRQNDGQQRNRGARVAEARKRRVVQHLGRGASRRGGEALS
jgi:hypothetical protein